MITVQFYECAGENVKKILGVDSKINKVKAYFLNNRKFSKISNDYIAGNGSF